MKRVFFGHRGVGKSSLLKRHQQYFSDVPHFDLDREIEKRSHRSVSEIFSKMGEAEFRRIEKSVFDELLILEHFVIALGAGYNPEQIPKQIEKIYVRRWTDQKGRVFIDRPRLNAEESPLNEYKLRYKMREPRFLNCADWIYDLPEGEWINQDIEKEIFKSGILKLAPYVTLDSEHLSLVYKFARLELRSDLLSESEVQQVLTVSSPEHEFILSIRNESGKKWLSDRSSIHALVDWALELGNPDSNQMKSIHILSLHDGRIQEQISRLGQFEKHTHVIFKLCPIVSSFVEIRIGYEWQQQDPQRRSFLPRSARFENPRNEVELAYREPRWRWFRELMLTQQPVQFCAQFQFIGDQVSVHSALLAAHSPPSSPVFGAVLGDPVLHSWTPLHHHEKILIPWFAIPIEKGALRESLVELRQLGLRCAAVTSPLKNEASDLTGITGCNSLVWTQKCWLGCNTDILALESVLSDLAGSQIVSPDRPIVFYGGGGILPEVRDLYPNIQFYSAQSAEPRSGSVEVANPSVVIWAAPRKEGILLPNKNWRPQKIYDLNYGDDSMAREWLQSFNGQEVEYKSGAEFFKIQAEHQVNFFKKELNHVS